MKSNTYRMFSRILEDITNGYGIEITSLDKIIDSDGADYLVIECAAKYTATIYFTDGEDEPIFSLYYDNDECYSNVASNVWYVATMVIAACNAGQKKS